MRWFRKYVLHNAGRKLLALGIAISLWAVYAPEPLEIGYDVPIAYGHASRDFALAADAPTAVHLLLRGRAALIRRINPADLSFTVDLSHVNPGETRVPLTPEMAGVPYGTDVVGLAPTALRISWVPAATSAPR
jgi:hypothetical protein